MTVKKLREKLSRFPDGAQVYVVEATRSGLTIVDKRVEKGSEMYTTNFVDVPPIGWQEDYQE